MHHPDLEPSQASKFVQKYPRNRIGYHFRIMMFGQDEKLSGTMTAVLLFGKKTTSLTCWVFNETNVSPSLPSPGRCGELWLHLWKHFGFANAIACDVVRRIEHLFYFSPAHKADSFQKYMQPLSFSTGATECSEYVLHITNHLVRTTACAM